MKQIYRILDANVACNHSGEPIPVLSYNSAGKTIPNPARFSLSDLVHLCDHDAENKNRAALARLLDDKLGRWSAVEMMTAIAHAGGLHGMNGKLESEASMTTKQGANGGMESSIVAAVEKKDATQTAANDTRGAKSIPAGPKRTIGDDCR